MPDAAPLPAAAALVPPALRPGRELLAEGRALARDWRVGRTPFLEAADVACEADYKRAMAARGRIMQHAHIGFRSVERTVGAIAEVHETCARRGVTVDRFGITLDWSMGYPAADRAGRGRGTGIVLNGPEDFARITCAAPAAAHFGDFMLGLPGALDNTKHALAAGATAIGNLGQYFTFRLPDWDDDIATTEATVTALGLIAAQDVEILVHSNLDDGFAGLFADMSATLGMVLIEKHIVEALIGARDQPLLRPSFHRAWVAAGVSSRARRRHGRTGHDDLRQHRQLPFDAGRQFREPVELSAGRYLGVAATAHRPRHQPRSRHRERAHSRRRRDHRGPDFCGRLVEHASESLGLVSFEQVDRDAEALVEGARVFAGRVLNGLDEAGVDTTDPAALMIALRRIGPGRLEALYGPGVPDPAGWGGRRAVVPAEWVEELRHAAAGWAERAPAAVRARLRASGLKVCVGASDVHEHGKMLIDQVLAELGLDVIDGGTSVDPGDLVARAIAGGADVVAVSTYNGIALRYAREVRDAMAGAGVTLPLCIGGRLNQVPDDSNSGLPVDVARDIEALGVVACPTPERADRAARRPRRHLIRFRSLKDLECASPE